MAHCSSHLRKGFSVFESMVGITLLSFSGAAMMATFDMALRTGAESMDQVTAHGVASLLMEEICSLPYQESGQLPNQIPLGPEVGESTRADFDDVDDYHGLISTPPTDRWGNPLGQGDGGGALREPSLRIANGLADWRTRTTVEYVNSDDHSTASATATAYRKITVFVEQLRDGAWTPIIETTRIVGYVPNAAS